MFALSGCEQMALMAVSDASVSMVIALVGSKCHRIGSNTITVFNFYNATCTLSSHPHSVSFRISHVSGAIILLKSHINLL
jgi:hypothetical protein